MSETDTTERPQQFRATGRRKTAVATVSLQPGEGRVLVNNRAFDEYFPTESLRKSALAPLETLQATKKFDIVATISGSGPMGQAGAMRHAVARALIKADPQLRPTLKAAGFLTRDPRMKERKKPGQPGARKRFQFSKR